jgi:hypothetical protein
MVNKVASENEIVGSAVGPQTQEAIPIPLISIPIPMQISHNHGHTGF